MYDTAFSVCDCFIITAQVYLYHKAIRIHVMLPNWIRRDAMIQVEQDFPKKKVLCDKYALENISVVHWIVVSCNIVVLALYVISIASKKIF